MGSFQSYPNLNLWRPCTCRYARLPRLELLPDVDRPRDVLDFDEEPLAGEFLPLDPEAAFVPALLPRDALLREAEPPLREPDVVLREFEVRVLEEEEDEADLRPEVPVLFLVAVRPDPFAALFEPALFRAVLGREPLAVDVLFPLVPAVFLAEAELLGERDEVEPPADLARLRPPDFPAAFRAVSPLISLLKLLFCPSAVVS